MSGQRPTGPDGAPPEEDGSHEERAARADVIVTELAANYAALTLADLAAARAALAAAKAEPAARTAHLDRVYGVAHNVKGQGTSFGYPLVTRIGQSLCRLMRGRADRLGEGDLAVVQAHLDALTLILEKRIRGDGGALGDKLAGRLEALTGGVGR